MADADKKVQPKEDLLQMKMSSKTKLPPIKRRKETNSNQRDKPTTNTINPKSSRVKPDFSRRSSHVSEASPAKARWVKAVQTLNKRLNKSKITEQQGKKEAELNRKARLALHESPNSPARLSGGSASRQQVYDKKTQAQGKVTINESILDNNREIFTIATNNIIESSAFLLGIEKQLAKMGDTLKKSLRNDDEIPENVKTTDQSDLSIHTRKRLTSSKESKYSHPTNAQRCNSSRPTHKI